MSFDRAGVVHERQTSSDRIEVSAKPGNEGPKCQRSGGLDIRSPLSELVSTTLDHDPGETTSVLTHGRQRRAAVTDGSEQLTVLAGELIRPAGQPHGDLPDARCPRRNLPSSFCSSKRLEEPADGLRAAPVAAFGDLSSQTCSVGASRSEAFSQVGLIPGEQGRFRHPTGSQQLVTVRGTDEATYGSATEIQLPADTRDRQTSARPAGLSSAHQAMHSRCRGHPQRCCGDQVPTEIDGDDDLGRWSSKHPGPRAGLGRCIVRAPHGMWCQRCISANTPQPRYSRR